MNIVMLVLQSSHSRSEADSCGQKSS